MKITLKNIILIVAALYSVAGEMIAQKYDSIQSETIAVKARPSPDSITLRWAPMNFKVWHLGNQHGYKVERYIIARNGSLLKEAEKSTLITSLKPHPIDQWESLAKNDKYGAITAQALFGERFEINFSQSDILTIVNKVNENEQRYAFALFSADMSPSVAQASGLWFSDKNVKKGEKYLYRIVINSIDSIRGSIFLSADELYELPKPQHFTAEFKDRLVSMKWDKNKTIHYTAYMVERSDDGRLFKNISESPLVTVSPNDTEDTHYDYAIDSLRDLSKLYYYRVKGITPFGEKSPPSEVVSGKGRISVHQPPYISLAASIENTSIQIRWDFPDESNQAIKGFTVERSPESKSNFVAITPKLLSPEIRIFEDKTPQHINYYRVTAIGLDGEHFPSHLFFAQLIDSIPPAHPEGLKATVNQEGMVNLSWNPSGEGDIYGYRVYKTNHRSQELAQITTEPISASSFTDHVNLNTLNEAVYYRVMCLDRSQNHSAFSEFLQVPLPDQVKPQAPVLLPIKSNAQGVNISWIQSSSEDVIQYAIYRSATEIPMWELVKIISASTDTVYSFTDETSAPNKKNHYTVVAVDEAGLESDPAYPVNGNKTNSLLRSAITWKNAKIDREQGQATLSWIYQQPDIKSFNIYKAVNNHSLILYKNLPAEKREFTDQIIPEQQYKYRIMAVFDDGNKSLLSEEIIFQY